MPPRTTLGSILRLAFAIAVAASLLSGCADSTAKKASKPGLKPKITKWQEKDCQPAGSHDSISYLLCWRPVGNQHGTFLRVEGGKKTTLPLVAPALNPKVKYTSGLLGYWRWAALSPDGSRFLAQWSGECEIPIAFFVSLGGGKPVAVTGESDWLNSPNTEAFGWTTDGRAIVFIPTKPGCGTGIFRPGIYLISESCRRELVWAGKRSPARLERSLKPRTVGQLRAILGPNAS